MFKLCVALIAVPGADFDPIKGCFGKNRGRIVDDDRLREIIGDFSQGFFVGFVWIGIGMAAIIASPEPESFHIDERPDIFDIGLLSGAPDIAFEMFSDMVEEGVQSRPEHRVVCVTLYGALGTVRADGIKCRIDECFVEIEDEYFHSSPCVRHSAVVCAVGDCPCGRKKVNFDEVSQ